MSLQLVEDPDEARFAQPVIDPEGVRFSRLKLFSESALHYLANVHADSATLDKGTAVHSILLGGKRVIYYDGKVKPKKGEPPSDKIGPRSGEQWERFKADNADAKILTQKEYDLSHRVADAVRANPLAMQALSGIAEETIRFDFLGLPCRSTPDVRAFDGSFVSELKTCRSSNPFRFAAQSHWMFYHVQMAFHREAMRRTKRWPSTGNPPTPFVVAVCSTPPFPVTVFKMTERAIEKGEKTFRFWFEQLKTCIASQQWPAYAQSVVDLDVPDGEEMFDGGAGEEGAETYSAESLPPGW